MRLWLDRLLVAAACLAMLTPLALLIWGAATNDLGANPVETLIRQLGVWGLRFLILGLAISPAARLFRAPRLIRFRRPVGLVAFSYILLHLVSYGLIDKQLDWEVIVKDILKRPYITIGMAAFALLIPLTATSFNAAIRKIGFRRWRGLHALIYLIVPAGVVHYLLLVKADHRPPLIYGALVLLLLGWRVWDQLGKRRGNPGRSTSRTMENPASHG